MLDRNLSRPQKVVITAILSMIGVVMLAPFSYMISISLASPATNAKENFTLIPREFYWQNFQTLFIDSVDKGLPVGQWFLNSTFVVVMSVIGQVFSSSLVAFGFAKMRYRHKSKLFLVLLATMMLPAQMTMLPVFLLWTKLGFFNTLWPLIIPAFFGSAFNIFFTRQFITALPGSLYEAAELDGLNPFQIYYRIVLPLLVPALTAIAIFTFSYAWEDFMGPLIYINDPNKQTLAYGIRLMSAASNPEEAVNLAVVMCLAMALSIPQGIVFILGQKNLFNLNLGVGNSGSK
ncbi:MAG TPA: carbohydrate ABC transporter permease [Arachnia sp.]|nr:carbohydrate ABC transporter permease [Arachnia sp.]HMT84750.1 carbohydrate ABC transporter permease [Arachnia sp.]